MHATRRCGGGQGRTAVAARGCTKRSLPGGVASGGRRPTVGTAPPAAGELQADASPVNELIWHAIGACGGLVGMWVGLSGGKVRARELGARCGGRIRTPVHPLAGHARSPRFPDILARWRRLPVKNFGGGTKIKRLNIYLSRPQSRSCRAAATPPTRCSPRGAHRRTRWPRAAGRSPAVRGSRPCLTLTQSHPA